MHTPLPMPRPNELDFADVERLTDQMLALHMAAARPFFDMIVVNSTSPTLVIVSDIDRIDQDTVRELCVDLQRRTGESGVLACLWQRITNDSFSVHTWIGIDPSTVHTTTVDLTKE